MTNPADPAPGTRLVVEWADAGCAVCGLATRHDVSAGHGYRPLTARIEESEHEPPCLLAVHLWGPGFGLYTRVPRDWYLLADPDVAMAVLCSIWMEARFRAAVAGDAWDSG